jgi:hypothetical protein
MNQLPVNPKNKPNTLISDLFYPVGEESWFVNNVCVFCDNQLLVKNRIYHMLDFLDAGGIKLTYLKLLDVFLKGFEVLLLDLILKKEKLLFVTILWITALFHVIGLFLTWTSSIKRLMKTK